MKATEKVGAREVLEPVVEINGRTIAIDRPLSVLDPDKDFSYWALADLRAAKVGAVELLYSPPYMIQISNQEGRTPISVAIPRHPEAFVVRPGDHARIRLMRDGELVIDNPDPAYGEQPR